MASHCEFINQHGKECTVKKRGAECPEGFFYCKNHLTYKSVKDRISGAIQAPKKIFNSKTTAAPVSNKNLKSIKNSSVKTLNSDNDISNIFTAEQAKNSIFKMLGEGKDETIPLRSEENNTEGDPISILKSILNDEEDTEILTKKQLNSKKIVERAVNSQRVQFSEEDEEEDYEMPERKVSRLSISSMLETSYWITMTAVEHRSLKLKGLNESLRSNDVLKDNLELAFKEILLFMGLEEDLGVESPCVMVLFATFQVLIHTLILNGGLDDLMGKFFKRKEEDPNNQQEQKSSRIIIDQQKYADIF